MSVTYSDVSTRLICYTHRRERTGVELHEGGDEVVDGERVVQQLVTERLRVGLHGRVEHVGHFDELAHQVRVLHVFVRRDEDGQHGDDMARTRVVEHGWHVAANTQDCSTDV